MSPPGRENSTLELKIISAKDVSHVSVTDEMDVYAVVSVTNKNTREKQTAKTPIDYNSGSNPSWNHSVKFSINEKAAGEGELNVLTIKLFSYWLKDENDLYLGEVNVGVHDLLGSTTFSPFTNGNDDRYKSATYPVKVIDVIKGTLSLMYRFQPIQDMYLPVSSSLGQSAYPTPNLSRSDEPVIYSPRFETGRTRREVILDMVIKFAKDIRDVNSFTAMNVYASVMILNVNTKVKDETKTPICHSAHKNPKWNHAVTFSINEKLIQEGCLSLVVKLISVRRLLGDIGIGLIKVPIQKLFGLNPPSPLTNGGDDGMVLVTESVIDSYGKNGTLSFMYRFKFKEEPVVQPIIMYVPVPDHGSLGYMTAHPDSQAGLSNGVVPIYIQSHGYQPYSPQMLQPQPQPQSPQYNLQSQSHPETQPNQSHIGYQDYAPLESQPPPQQPTQSQPQTQNAGPSIGLGAAVLGRVIGGAIMNEVVSGGLNII